MNKEEALEFMGLKEPVSKETIMARFNERFSYFQMLHANAPNKIIESIQQQNMEKLDHARKELLNGLQTKQMIQEKKFSASAFDSFKEATPQVDENQVMAWLIVHTENKSTTSYNLYLGENYLGRKKNPDLQRFIVIEDNFISRTHALIKCSVENGHLEIDLFDGDGVKTSANGIYINGRDNRVNRHCHLKENDTIQLGNTKLVLKINHEDSSISHKIAEVLNTSYIRTIDINR